MSAGLLVLAGGVSAHPSVAPHLHAGDPGGLVALLTLLVLAVAGALLLVLRLRARASERLQAVSNKRPGAYPPVWSRVQRREKPLDSR